MGCTNSKQVLLGSNGDARLPFSRGYSLSFRRSTKRLAAAGAGNGGGNQHVVSLMSSTLGTLCLDRSDDKAASKSPPEMDGEDVEDEWLEERRKEPSTPMVTPPDEPETINTWEMMAGLENVSPIRPLSLVAAVERSLSFPAAGWSPETSTNWHRKETPEHVKEQETKEEKELVVHKTSLVKARIHAFQEKINTRMAMVKAARVVTVKAQPRKCPPHGEGKVVVYITTLRGVRKTYEDCCDVLVILRGYGMRIDERDMSMHSGFKDELYGILGVISGGLRLPRVFANGRYIGGAEEIRQMHEMGDLSGALEGCAAPLLAVKGGSSSINSCRGCGNMRFVPCEVCSGSCKVFVDDVEEERKQFGNIIGFRRCMECNENGLVRCPICCAD